MQVSLIIPRVYFWSKTASAAAAPLELNELGHALSVLFFALYGGLSTARKSLSAARAPVVLGAARKNPSGTQLHAWLMRCSMP
jgi:hypothetical protein